MKKYQLQRPSNQINNLETATANWREKDFYRTAVVLGIDIGFEGIGICLRRGTKILHAATWVIPWAKPLAERRAKRAWRHCRLNLKVRMLRLKRLYERHGLPWFEERDPMLLHTDPFDLRHKAITRGLDSPEELALAIRHVVAHRGHHYNYYNDEGEYPWGEDHDFKAACGAIQAQYLTGEEADKFSEDCVEFGWADSKIQGFRKLVESRRATGSEILDHLSIYCSQPRRNLRRSPKGTAYPRSLVWRHLEEIITKNSRFLHDVQGFLKELSIHPETNKKEAIFFYHRKTPAEMREHFQKKTKRCSFSPWIGIGGDVPCDTREKIEIRRFLLLEFLSTRRVEVAGSNTTRVNLSPTVVEKLLTWQKEFEARKSSKGSGWREGKKIFEDSMKEAGLWPLAKKSQFNEDFLERLQDILCPTPANRKKKSNLSCRAAEHLFKVATADGYSPASVVRLLGDYFKKRREAVLDPSGRYPQVDFLLGAVAKRDRTPTNRHPNRKQKGQAASVGKLQKLFGRYTHELNGRLTPDFCIIEVISDPPRTEKQKKEIQKEIQKRREEHQKRLESLDPHARASRTARMRIKLFEQQRGMSPFTGISLGNDPLADGLQLCHLYPDSRGGLFMEDNLVLAPRSENTRMENRTPKEAAQDLAGSWEKMVSFTGDMKWSHLKREIFGWEGESVPDFGNTTRMSQLARQLYVAVGEWMGLRDIDDPTLRENRRQERIGTPSGFITSVARAAWNMPRKDRNDLVHHAVDAITLAWLAPGAGMNSVRCGGILFNEHRPESGKSRLSVLPLGPNPSDVEAVTSDTAEACPVVLFRTSSIKTQMHDTTLLGMRADGRLASHIPFGSQKEELDPVSVKKLLLDAGIPPARMPSKSQVESWLADSESSSIRLGDGQPIRRRLKPAKNDRAFFPGLGYVGRSDGGAKWVGLRVVQEKYKGVELWRNYDFKKSRWDFSLRRIPESRAMESLLRMAFSWFHAMEGKFDSTQASLSKRLEKTLRSLKLHPCRWQRISRGTIAAKTLQELVVIGFPIDGVGPRPWEEVEKAIFGDSLPVTARPVLDKKARPTVVRKGQLFRIPVTSNGKLADAGRSFELHWFEVSAILSDKRVEFKAVRRSDWKKIPLSRGNLFRLFGLSEQDDPPLDSPE